MANEKNCFLVEFVSDFSGSRNLTSLSVKMSIKSLWKSLVSKFYEALSGRFN